MATYSHHAEAEAQVASRPSEIFAYLDKHSQLSGHMSKSSWMMGGGRMDMTSDAGGFQRVGSRLRLAGKAFGLRVVLDEQVTIHESPQRKVWETVGTPRLLVIGHYRMGFDITSAAGVTRLRVFIDYDLPKSTIERVLGYLFGGVYARWCVNSMVRDARGHFAAAGAVT
jgi:hypothetical protein